MECYLCGAENSPDSDFCYRCDGQLLKINLENEEGLDLVEDAEDFLTEEAEEAEKAPSVRSRLPSIRSAEHSRLHDALGLGSNDEPGDDRGAAIPKVKTTSVPMIGTRPGAFNSTQAQQQGVSRRAMVVITVLAAVVAILGYRTLTYSNPIEPPPEIAFQESTVPLPPEDTTPQLRPWTQNELIGKFAPTFVTVLLYDCPSGERFVTNGVAVDETNVVFARGDAPSIDAIVILSNLGNRAIARHNKHPSGADVATTWRSLSRTLDLTTAPSGEESFLISRDINSSTTAVGDTDDIDTEAIESDDETADTASATSSTLPGQSMSATISIASSSQGDALAVAINDARYELDQLLDIVRYRAELVEGAGIALTDVCAASETIVPATPAEAPPTTNRNNNGEITVAET